MRLACRAKDKKKHTSRKRYQFVLYWHKDIIITLVWASIHCELKMEKQDSEAGESR